MLDFYLIAAFSCGSTRLSVFAVAYIFSQESKDVHCKFNPNSYIPFFPGNWKTDRATSKLKKNICTKIKYDLQFKMNSKKVFNIKRLKSNKKYVKIVIFLHKICQNDIHWNTEATNKSSLVKTGNQSLHCSDGIN